jgi:uncharacterized membrane protein YwzB
MLKYVVHNSHILFKSTEPFIPPSPFLSYRSTCITQYIYLEKELIQVIMSAVFHFECLDYVYDLACMVTFVAYAFLCPVYWFLQFKYSYGWVKEGSVLFEQCLLFFMYRSLGPAVRTLLEQYHLQSSQITATGRKGKLLKGDVLKYITDNKLKPKMPKEGNLTIEMFCDLNCVKKHINLLSVLIARRILHCSG